MLVLKNQIIFSTNSYRMARRTTKDQALLQKFAELERKNQEALLGGGETRIEQQHAKGKLTARERIACCWMRDHSKSWENS